MGMTLGERLYESWWPGEQPVPWRDLAPADRERFRLAAERFARSLVPDRGDLAAEDWTLAAAAQDGTGVTS